MNCTTFNIRHKIILLNKVVQMNYFPQHPSWWIRSPLATVTARTFVHPAPTSRASRRRCWDHLLIYTSWYRIYLRWTQFCDPLKKKNWDEFTGGLFFKKYCIQDVHHNNSNNSEGTFVKLSEKNNILLRNLLMFSNNLLRVTVLSLPRSKEQNNRFVFNEIWKFISIKLLIFRFDKGNLMLSINAVMLK